MMFKTGRWMSTLLLGGVLLAGCDDPLEPEEHPEAGGVLIRSEASGAVLARSVGAGAAFDNALTVPRGGVLEVEVLLLDADAPTDLARAFLPDEDEGESLEIRISNGALVSFTSHGDHADFSGLLPGTTTATFDLMHGGHADFSSGPLTIIVQ